MDIKITVCSLTLGVACALGMAIPVLIAAGALPVRLYGLGHLWLAVAMCLYVRRQVRRVLSSREEIAFQLGQASDDIRKGSLAGVRSLVD